MRKITKEECQKRLREKFPLEPVSILTYEKMSSPITYKCDVCGKEHYLYKASDLFFKKHLCNDCWYGKGKGEKTLIEKDEALKIIQENEDLVFIKFGYNSKLMKNTIQFHCNKCGMTSELQLKFFIKRKKCPGCSYNAKHLTTTGIQARLKDYTLLEEYQGTDTKILVRHNDCGFIWKTTPHNLISGFGCPKCSKRNSKGERKIIDFLTREKIEFSREHKFEWSNDRRYDFYLPEFNLVIEYMGIQHYKEVSFFRTSLEEQKRIDNWKKEQALLNQLDYLAISYENFEQIDNILAQRLSRKESRESPKRKASQVDEDIV